MHDPLPDPTCGMSAEAECKAPQNDGTTVPWTVLLNPAGIAFDAPPGVPLLQAAEQAGIDMPSSCRNGTCRTCLCQLLAGAVTLERRGKGGRIYPAMCGPGPVGLEDFAAARPRAVRPLNAIHANRLHQRFKPIAGLAESGASCRGGSSGLRPGTWQCSRYGTVRRHHGRAHPKLHCLPWSARPSRTGRLLPQTCRQTRRIPL